MIAIVHTFFCDCCGSTIELMPTNNNARLNMVCRGREPLPVPNGAFVTGDHKPTEMRQIGAKPL